MIKITDKRIPVKKKKVKSGHIKHTVVGDSMALSRGERGREGLIIQRLWHSGPQ